MGALGREGGDEGLVFLEASPLTTLLLLLFLLFTNILGTGSSDRSGGYPARPPGGSNGADDNRPLPSNPRELLQGVVIVVDPGHGGPSNPGAVGVGPSPEKDNVLAIGLYLKEMLERSGAQVVMTRAADVDPGGGRISQLDARVRIANRSGARLFVSIHNDWNSNSGVSGTTTYYYYKAYWGLAHAIQQELTKALGSRSHGERFGNFQVLRETIMPSVLVEVGFVSNPKEAWLLSQNWYRLSAARGIYNGIVRYLQYGS